MNNSVEILPEGTTSVDRISNLPDDILCHILCLLNTEQAVATSILSKRWKFLWTNVDTLDFSNVGSKSKLKKLKYMQFVCRVLEFHRAPLTKSIQLIIYELSDPDFVAWTQTVLSAKNVQSLDLRFAYKSLQKWPLCFYSNKTLVHLFLAFVDITNMVNSPTAPFFPNLKKLTLSETSIDTNSLRRFISGCLILEELTLTRYFVYEPPKALYISSATLKELCLSWKNSTCDKPKIVLNTPALEVFVFRIREIRQLELLAKSSMPSLYKAHIHISVCDLPRNLSSDSTLSFFSGVSVLCLEAKYEGQPVKLDSDIQFHKLTELEIKSNRIGMDLLRICMEKSNNLRVITLKKWFYNKPSSYKNWVIWEEPQHVPRCFLSSLELIVIEGYNYEDEVELMRMIKYVLGHAIALKSMKICKPYRLDMVQKISTFPRASPLCEISVN